MLPCANLPIAQRFPLSTARWDASPRATSHSWCSRPDVELAARHCEVAPRRRTHSPTDPKRQSTCQHGHMDHRTTVADHPGFPDAKLRAAAAPESHDTDSRVGVVLSHGFTGTPDSMRPLAHACRDAGWNVRLPLLPGHGTRWQELNDSDWTQWAGEVDRVTRELLDRCDVVVVAGLSMGGTLATLMAQRHPEVAGLFLINPAFTMSQLKIKAVPFVSRFVPSIPAIAGDIKKQGVREAAYDRTPLRAVRSQMKLWETVTDALPQLRTPTVLAHSREDHVVPPACSELFLRRTGSTWLREVVLENSYHVATHDNDAHILEKELLAFVRSLEAFRRGDLAAH